MRGHLETSLGGIHLGLITFLFIVFLLWRQFHILTLRNKNKSMHPIPTPCRLPTTQHAAQHVRTPDNTNSGAHAHPRTLFLSFFRLISVNSEFPSLSEPPGRACSYR